MTFINKLREQKLEEYRRAGREVLLEDASKEVFEAGVKAREFPPGSVHHWSVGVFGPPQDKREER